MFWSNVAGLVAAMIEGDECAKIFSEVEEILASTPPAPSKKAPPRVRVSAAVSNS